MNDIILEKEISEMLEKAFSHSACEYYDDFASFLGEDEVKSIFASVYYSHAQCANQIEDLFKRKDEERSISIWSNH